MNSYFPNPFIFPKQKKTVVEFFLLSQLLSPPIVRDRFLYVANQNKNMIEIYNISNPIFPVHVGEFNGENLNIPSGLATTGNILYVANAGDNTIEIYNISNPMDPIRIRGFNEGNLNAPAVLAITGTTLYVANAFGNNVEIYDISNPIIPVHAGAFDGTNLNFPNGLAVLHYSAGEFWFNHTTPHNIEFR